MEMHNRLNIQIPAAPLHQLWKRNGVQLDVLREDMNHPLIQGNKFRKLKYNLIEAHRQNLCHIITFGGAFSNHIYAVAAAGKSFGFRTTGIIRGEELAGKKRNHTLRQAEEMGMELRFIQRSIYREKDQEYFLTTLKKEFPKGYILPEGGTNELAVKGCAEIMHSSCSDYDFICVAVGTAGTISGILRSSKQNQTVIGFPSLKNSEYLMKTVKKFTDRTNYKFINTYHFGGYAGFSSELITFVNEFYATTSIPIEPVYTGKMFYGLNDLINADYFPEGSKILAIHSGGLQGVKGFNEMHDDLLKVEV